MDFKKLKDNKDNLASLTAKLEEQAKKETTGFATDETYWTVTVDKAGNGSATIRFLPTSPHDPEDSLPWVKFFSHNFKGPGGWYIENCLTTLGQPDPCSEYNTKLWNTGIEANKNKARDQKRKLNIVSNILVISDPAKPECEGKVFKYRYGVKIHEMQLKMMNGEGDTKLIKDYYDEDVPCFDPFNFWTGANFQIKVKKVAGSKGGDQKFTSYEDSKFKRPSPIAKTDKEIEAIWKQEYCLSELVGPKAFKTYDELKARLDKVLGNESAPDVSVKETTVSKPTAETVSLSQVKENLPFDGGVKTPTLEENTTEGTQSPLDYFRKLAEAD